MSTIAISPVHRAVRFYEAPIGKKVVMALTGVILFGYVLAHLLGNLQIFGPPDQINKYAAFLHNPANAGLLWVARSALLLAVILHIVASIQLWNLKREARPVAYIKKDDAAATYASRTMMWSGPIVAAFVIYHLMQFTFGVGGTRYSPSDPYGNVIAGFRNPLVSIAYVIAMALLCLHLRHGLWSAFQTLGVCHPRYTPRIRALASLAALLIFFGFASIPVAILAGVVPQIF